MPGSYYNLPPGSSFVELSDFEKLLRGLPLERSKAALDLLETLTRNVIQHPTEDKYRRLRTTNEKLAALFGTEGSLAIMYEMGWQQDGEFIVLPKEVKLDFPKHIVKMLEAKGHYAKQESIKRGSAKLGRDPAKAGMLQQLELERKERGLGANTSANLPDSTKAAETPAAPATRTEEAPHQPPAAEVSEERKYFHNGQQAPSLGPNASVPATTISASGQDVEQDSSSVADTVSTDVPDSTISTVEQLISMGIPENGAKRACLAVQNAGADQAASWYFEHIDDPDINDPPTAPGGGGTPNKPPSSTPAQQTAPSATPKFEPAPRTEAEGKENRKEMSLQELRALQKSKYGDFKADPSKAESDAYKKPASTSGGSKEAGWFDWMWGGSSSTSSSGGGGGGGRPQGPTPGQRRIKTVG